MMNEKEKEQIKQEQLEEKERIWQEMKYADEKQASER